MLLCSPRFSLGFASGSWINFHQSLEFAYYFFPDPLSPYSSYTRLRGYGRVTHKASYKYIDHYPYKLDWVKRLSNKVSIIMSSHRLSSKGEFLLTVHGPRSLYSSMGNLYRWRHMNYKGYMHDWWPRQAYKALHIPKVLKTILGFLQPYNVHSRVILGCHRSLEHIPTRITSRYRR